MYTNCIRRAYGAAPYYTMVGASQTKGIISMFLNMVNITINPNITHPKNHGMVGGVFSLIVLYPQIASQINANGIIVNIRGFILKAA